MNKIRADHLSRKACVYIRQSTPGQVQHNLESQRRQYGLVDRAGRSAGKMSKSLTRIWAAQVRARTGKALSACSGSCATVASVRYLPSKLLGWRAMAATGIRCWSSAAWSAPC